MAGPEQCVITELNCSLIRSMKSFGDTPGNSSGQPVQGTVIDQLKDMLFEV